jgi:hypothetical protein
VNDPRIIPFESRAIYRRVCGAAKGGTFRALEPRAARRWC